MLLGNTVRSVVLLSAVVIFVAACGGRVGSDRSPVRTSRAVTDSPADMSHARIAFSSRRAHDGGTLNTDVYVMDADGRSQMRLTTNRDGDADPVWSPDGARIAYVREFDIWVMNADGTHEQRLTRTQASDYGVSWSPDGSRIAFHSTEQTDAGIVTSSAIIVIDSDGSHPTRLTDGRRFFDFFPQWSPDGRRIAFARGQPAAAGTVNGVYLMNADGSGQTLLAGGGTGPVSWSPNGHIIAFAGIAEPTQVQSTDVYLVDIDGGGRTRLTTDPAQDAEPAWSPDGRQIAFTSWRTGFAEIYVMKANGSGQTRLTHDDQVDNNAAWSP